MNKRLQVATRKGLFTLEPSAGTFKITNTAFLGDPVTMSYADPRDGALYAALNLGHFGVKMHRSADKGKTWEEIGVPAYPKNPEESATREAEGDAAKAPSLKQIWCLEAGNKNKPGTLWAGTIPGGLFRSHDRGDSWELMTSLWEQPERAKWFGGGYDQAGIHSVEVDPRAENRITVGVSVGGIWLSEDNGETWNVIGNGMYAEFMPPETRGNPHIQDPHRMVTCPAKPDVVWVQHHNGVFRSTDGARNFVELHPKPAKFGFAVVAHPTDPETAWFVPGVKDECRIPVDGQMVVNRTRDGGNTFQTLRKGLPQEHAYDLVFRHAMDIDAEGNTLAMGSTTGTLWTSDDQGDSWNTVSNYLPPIYSVRFEK